MALGETGYLTEEQEQRALEGEQRAITLFGDESACDACGGVGWLHIMTDCGPEIEACDACTRGRDREENAIRRHRIQCGCEWPENAPHHPHYQGRTMFPVPTFSEAMEG